MKKRFVWLLLLVVLMLGVVVTHFVRRWGVDHLPVLRGGEIDTADLVPAPPAQDDGGPVLALPEVPAGGILFDLKYVGQTGGKGDIQYHSYWGFGGSQDDATPFIKEARQKSKTLSVVRHSMLRGREYSAVERDGRKIIAFYFDLDADGKLGDLERIPPTRKEGSHAVDFITPDFVIQSGRDGKPIDPLKFRVMLQVGSYSGNSELSFMWSPACVLQGTAKVDAQPARMVLFADGFDARFDRYGASTCALLVGDQATAPPEYFPRETLSSLVQFNDRFYRLRLEGRRSHGHPARAVLIPDTSPTGTLLVKLVCTNPVSAKINSLYLRGVEDPTIYLNVSKAEKPMPVATYQLVRGNLSYGDGTNSDWYVSFSDGQTVSLVAGQRTEVALSEPTLKVRALDEKDRYQPEAKESSVFSAGTRIYLEPKIACRTKETLSRFSHGLRQNGQPIEAPPTLRITSADGNTVLAKTMEYG